MKYATFRYDTVEVENRLNPVQSVYISGDSETIEGQAEGNIDGWGIPRDKKTYFLEFNK